jgi:amino acid adenylation domain-containing protein
MSAAGRQRAGRHQQLPNRNGETVLSRDNIKDIYPLTPFQEGVVFHDLMEREAAHEGQRAYFQQMSFTVRGPLDIAAFRRAWQFLVDRHDVLRTVFRPTGAERPLQIVLKARELVPDVVDCRALGPDAAGATCERYEAEQRQRPFDLRRDLLVRLGLLLIAPEETRVVFGFHHVLMDGWCIGILQDDLTRAYQAFTRGDAPRLPAAVQFGGFVKASERRRTARALDFWRDYLADYETAVALPGRRPVALDGPRDSLTHEAALGEALTAQLDARARALGVTPGTLAQALWGVLLAKMENRRDVVFGTMASTRLPDLPGGEAVLGPCIGMLPLRIRYAPSETFAELVAQVHAQRPGWLGHVHCALADIQQASAPRGALIGHYFVYENYPLDARFRGEAQVLAPGVTIHDVRMFQTGNYDFGALMLPGESARLVLTFNSRAVDPAAVARIGRWFVRLARQAAGEPDCAIDAMTLLDDEEAARIEAWGRGAEPGVLAPDIAALRRDVVARRGEAPAVRAGGRTLSHAELEARARGLAAWFRRAHGIGPGDPVALHLPAGEGLVTAMLACLLLGAPFVPLDPGNPALRTAHILKDSGARLVLAQGALPEEAAAGVPVAQSPADPGALDGEALPAVDADATAYIIYTSGTTGVPKGVRVGQSALINYVGWFGTLSGAGPDMRTALVTSAAFDLGYTGLFGALLGGGCVSLPDEDERRDPAHVLALLADHGIMVLKTTPSYLSMLLATPGGEARLAGAGALRLLLLGGEPQNFAELRRLRQRLPGLRIYNHYGPTEATIGCAAGPLDDLADRGEGPQRLGRPIAGVRLFVCDAALRPVPPGVPGELLVAGRGLAQGYVNASPADAARFAVLPWCGGLRVYRTGDRVRWADDGTLEFLGRVDDQVKVRGYRVSLKEVEAALTALECVRDAAVVTDARGGATELVAYVVPEGERPEGETTPAAIRAALARRLPPPMIPARFIAVSRFPLTANGKTDRKALTEHRRPQAPAPGAPEAGNETEEKLRAIWREVLFLDHVGLDDDFFALGGHSLKAILVASKARAVFERPLTLRSLFDHPTVRRLAVHIVGGATPTPVGGDRVLPLRAGSSDAPLAVFFPPALGTSTPYRDLVEPLAGDVACIGMQAPGFDRDEPFAENVADCAGHFVRALRPLIGQGRRLRLVGWSMGAHFALETALQLEAENGGHRSPALELILLDSAPPAADDGTNDASDGLPGFAALRTRPYWGRVLAIMDAMPPADLARIERLARHNHAAVRRHRFTGVVHSPVTCLEAADALPRAGMEGFRRFAAGRFAVHEVGGDHYSMFHPPHLNTVLSWLEQLLTASGSGAGATPAASAPGSLTA